MRSWRNISFFMTISTSKKACFSNPLILWVWNQTPPLPYPASRDIDINAPWCKRCDLVCTRAVKAAEWGFGSEAHRSTSGEIPIIAGQASVCSVWTIRCTSTAAVFISRLHLQTDIQKSQNNNLNKWCTVMEFLQALLPAAGPITSGSYIWFKLLFISALGLLLSILFRAETSTYQCCGQVFLKGSGTVIN